MSKEYTHAVFIGRFQPFHNQHEKIARQGLAIADELILVIGSTNTAQVCKNPFNFEERKKMISACFSEDELKRIHFVGVEDHYYSEALWLSEVQSKVQCVTGTDSERICLVGHFKDQSSDYLKSFQEWDFIPAECNHTIHATDIRNALFSTKDITNRNWKDRELEWYHMVPKSVELFIMSWARTDIYHQLREEYEEIKKYKAQWDGTPYPPVFVTTDTVVIKSGHVLVITRRMHPGKGLWALPGGFLMKDKSLEYSAIKELKQETRIQVDAPALRNQIKAREVFDYPDRDPRGRTITHAFLIDLGNGPLPKVRGGDDAAHAMWIPAREVFEHPENFYADHAHILYHFLMTKRWN